MLKKIRPSSFKVYIQNKIFMFIISKFIIYKSPPPITIYKMSNKILFMINKIKFTMKTICASIKRMWKFLKENC